MPCWCSAVVPFGRWIFLLLQAAATRNLVPSMFLQLYMWKGKSLGSSHPVSRISLPISECSPPLRSCQHHDRDLPSVWTIIRGCNLHRSGECRLTITKAEDRCRNSASYPFYTSKSTAWRAYFSSRSRDCGHSSESGFGSSMPSSDNVHPNPDTVVSTTSSGDRPQN